MRRPGIRPAGTLDPADDDPRPAEWPIPIVDPSGPGPLLWIVPVPEPKALTNRMHVDVLADTAALLAVGARPVRMQEDDIPGGTCSPDPEGDELCVFAPE